KKANKADVDTELAKKANKADVDTELAKKANKKEFEEERERSKTADKQQDIGIAENVKEIERLDNEKDSYRFVDSAIAAGKAALDKEKEERKKEDKALEKSLVDTYNGLNNRLVNEVDSRTKEDAKLATKIKQNKEAIADNKKAIENLDDKVETHDMAIKALKNNKADKVETEKALNNLNENLNNEVKNRKSADRILKKAIENEEAARKAADEKHDKGIADNKTAIDNEAATREAADKKHDAAIAENKAGIEANASAIKHLDSKLNKTTAMMTAMNNVDFQDVNAGEVAIGAGVGHFVGSQAVAVGVAYGVNDDLKVHAKLSGVAGDAHYNAIGGGVTYKFRTR
ncbi:YadA C-terminal domain-containing protein, partial [Fusobacterium gonidiaformans]|uniref:YadA C-terminal domain-containing protein n=1 Tax=Fusobacterium gonidiaformans TaxID=849 RepID=UPI0023F3EC3F